MAYDSYLSIFFKLVSKIGNCTSTCICFVTILLFHEVEKVCAKKMDLPCLLLKNGIFLVGKFETAILLKSESIKISSAGQGLIEYPFQ